jgi:hypothetical protein
MQIEQWTDSFFQNMLNLLNSFFCRLDVAEAIARMELIPFEQLVADELEGEKPEIISIAVARVKELAEIEIEFMRAYLKKD